MNSGIYIIENNNVCVCVCSLQNNIMFMKNYSSSDCDYKMQQKKEINNVSKNTKKNQSVFWIECFT